MQVQNLCCNPMLMTQEGVPGQDKNGIETHCMSMTLSDCIIQRFSIKNNKSIHISIQLKINSIQNT